MQCSVDAQVGLAGFASGFPEHLDFGVFHAQPPVGLAISLLRHSFDRGKNSLFVNRMGVALEKLLERRDAARTLGPLQSLLFHVPLHESGLFRAFESPYKRFPVHFLL